MELYPKDLYEKLEFNKLLQLISIECQGESGREQILSTCISVDKAEIDRMLCEADEYKKCLERSAPIPCGPYEKIEQDLFFLSKEGYVLEVDSIQRLHRIMHLGMQIYHHFQDYQLQKSAPHLSQIALEIQLDAKLIKEIERIFDDEGNVRPNASDQLLKISKSIVNKEREVEKTFHQNCFTIGKRLSRR